MTHATATRRDSRLRVVVTGLIAQHPTLGGVAWDYAQYVIGLARLGHEVYYVEDSGQWPYNLDGGESGEDWVARDPAKNLDHLRRVLAPHGLEDRWAYRFPRTGAWYGLPDSRRREVLRTADVLLNVSGTLEHPAEYRQVDRLVYIDSDPVFTQVKLAAGQREFGERVDAHDLHFSFGECFSKAVPATGHAWLPTRTPIVLSLWRPNQPRRDAYTTVMSWTSYEPLTHQGIAYGQKDVEFLRFADLPRQLDSLRSPAGEAPRLEVALGATQHVNWQTPGTEVTPAARDWIADRRDWEPAELLSHLGWRVVDAGTRCGDMDSYRKYIESSKAEWSVAKNGYVRGQAGWFSCRTACYLAAGRPSVVQDTGFGGVIPAGEGVLTFRTLEEAQSAIQRIEGDYERHAAAARDLAATYFDSSRVLNHLLERVFAGGRATCVGA